MITISKPISALIVMTIILFACLFMLPHGRSEAIEQENYEPGFFETSEYMIGKVAVLTIFIDDPSTTWSPDEIDQALNDIKEALNWWQDKASENNVPLEFKLFYLPEPIYTEYVPSEMSPDRHCIWLSGVLDKMGYHKGDCTHRGRKIVNELREREKTDWGFLIFMVKDSEGVGFKGEAAGFAILGGPYLVDGWMPKEFRIGIPGIDLDVIKLNELNIAHEIAHIFYATDEYDNKPTISGYFGAQDNDDSKCLMDAPVDAGISELIFALKEMLGFWCLSEGTKRQIGWVDDNHNKIPDVLEVDVKTDFTGFKPITDDDSLDFTGRIILQPPPNKNPYGSGREVTIVKIKRVSATISLADKKETFLMSTVQGDQPDSPTEEIHFVIPFLGIGEHQININIENNFGYYKTVIKMSSIHTFILIDKSSQLPERTDVGKPVKVGFHAVWAHNGEPLTKGILLINGVQAKPATDGWFYITDTSQSVGKKTYSITGGRVDIVVETDGQKFEDRIEKIVSKVMPVSIIYDKVRVTLKSEKERIDVGNIPKIYYDAYYEYDKAPFQGQIEISPEPKPLNSVGHLIFRVEKVIDRKYGLTAFESNELKVIFDKVIVKFSPLRSRVQVGKTLWLTVRAWYAYDHSPFSGLLIIDGREVIHPGHLELKIRINPEYRIVTKTIMISQIIDKKYGLSLFESETASIKFDKIKAHWAISPEFFVVKANVNLEYESDSTPVEDARIMINGATLRHVGAGRYSGEVFFPGPFGNLTLTVERSGFDTITKTVQVFNMANTIFYIIITIAVLVGILFIVIHRPKEIAEAPKPQIKYELRVPSLKTISEKRERIRHLLKELDELRNKKLIDEQTYQQYKSLLLRRLEIVQADLTRELSKIFSQTIQAIEKQIKVKRETLKTLTQRLSSGIISEEAYLKLSSELISEIKELNKSLERWKSLLKGLSEKSEGES